MRWRAKNARSWVIACLLWVALPGRERPAPRASARGAADGGIRCARGSLVNSGMANDGYRHRAPELRAHHLVRESPHCRIMTGTLPWP